MLENLCIASQKIIASEGSLNSEMRNDHKDLQPKTTNITTPCVEEKSICQNSGGDVGASIVSSTPELK